MPQRLPSHHNSMSLGNQSEVLLALRASLPHMPILQFAEEGHAGVEQDIHFYGEPHCFNISQCGRSLDPRGVMHHLVRLIAPTLEVTEVRFTKLAMVCTLRVRDPLLNLVEVG